ncbi:unnamed protein product [Agarophyton chilense]
MNLNLSAASLENLSIVQGYEPNSQAVQIVHIPAPPSAIRPPSSLNLPFSRPEINNLDMVFARKVALEAAITSCIHDTFQTEEARNKLMEACASLNPTDETSESVLSDFSQMVLSKALEKTDQWSREHDMPRKWEIIDRYATLAPALAATMNGDITLPCSSNPQLKLTEQLMAQKMKEIDKLQQIAAERHSMLAEMNRQTEEQVDTSQDLTNNIGNSFTLCMKELENCSQTIN